MPKRKHEDDYEYIKKKLRRLERKLKRRSVSSESSSRSPPAAERTQSETRDIDFINNLLGPANGDQISDVSPPEQQLFNDQAEPGPITPQNETLAEIIETAARTATDPSPPAGPALAAPTPLASAPSTPTPAAPATATQLVPPDSVLAKPGTDEVGLDADLLELLGTDPSTIKKYGKEIQKDLSLRLEHCATTGLSKELRKELKEKYLTPDNCKLIDPPELNAELKAAVSEIVSKRDKAIEGKQNQLSSAISCLAEAITLLMSHKERNTTVLKLLIDGARIMCDCQHADTITRRNFILNVVKKDMKDQLQGTKIDKFLLSESLADTLKSAKAISKSGSDLKISTPKAPTKKAVPGPSNPPRNLNWRNPGPARRQPGPPRMKEPATISTRNRPATSWKPSQQQQQRSYNRR